MGNWSLSIPEEIYDYDGKDVALPSFYEKACIAVKECSEIPEANEWKGKAEAIIAYSKTVDDKRLENYAKRIKARAYRRMGELLKQYDARPDNNKSQTIGTHGLTSQKEVAQQNGITPNKQLTAVRLANVPEQQFTEQIDRETPATITELAAQGTNKQEPKGNSFLYSEKPKGFSEALYLKGDTRSLVEKMEKYDPLFIMGGMDADDIEEMRTYISTLEAWCDTFIINIE